MSEQGKHTAGPWTREGIFVGGRDRFRVTDCFVGERSPDENRANARLIAAAPEMLKALRWVVENLANIQSHPEEYSHGRASSQAAKFRTIIHKATGEGA